MWSLLCFFPLVKNVWLILEIGRAQNPRSIEWLCKQTDSGMTYHISLVILNMDTSTDLFQKKKKINNCLAINNESCCTTRVGSQSYIQNFRNVITFGCVILSKCSEVKLCVDWVRVMTWWNETTGMMFLISLKFEVTIHLTQLNVRRQ